jgi:uncharacterized protein RhaS with RHS repeats
LHELGIYDYRHRYYNPELGRFLQTDPVGLQTEGEKLNAGQKALFWAGTAPEAFSTSEMNLFRYCHNDPVNRSDPLGLAGIHVDYPDYAVDTGIKIPGVGNMFLTLGHAGVVAVDSAGKAKYYEYGRYDGTDGAVRSVPVPDLVMDSNGNPTPESLQKLGDHLSKTSGKDGRVVLTYDKAADDKKITEYANGVTKDPPKWSASGPNCKTFASDALKAGNHKEIPTREKDKKK